MAKWTLWCALLAPLLAHAAPGAKTSPPIPPLLLPATGYWYDAERPGTGFALERRGNTLGVIFYHFSDVPGQALRIADWHLAHAPLVGNTFEATLLHFEDGSCIGCDPFAEADVEETDVDVRLVFASAREATLTIDAGEPRRVVAMPFGVPYEAALATPPDLPLPDLLGRWVVAGAGREGVITLTERHVVEAGVEFRGVASGLGLQNASVVCGPEQCTLTVDALPDFSPAPITIAQFPLGDITEERMTGADGLTFHVVAFRVQGTEVQP